MIHYVSILDPDFSGWILNSARIQPYPKISIPTSPEPDLFQILDPDRDFLNFEPQKAGGFVELTVLASGYS